MSLFSTTQCLIWFVLTCFKKNNVVDSKIICSKKKKKKIHFFFSVLKSILKRHQVGRVKEAQEKMIINFKGLSSAHTKNSE